VKKLVRVNVSTVEVTVKSMKRKYVFGHKVGDKIVFDGRSVKGEVCYSALMVLLPKVFAMRYDASFPWAQDKDVIFNACPDSENSVVFEIRRIQRKAVAKQPRKHH
jgi:uncharacterized repeat protein (TIGR04076 family)